MPNIATANGLVELSAEEDLALRIAIAGGPEQYALQQAPHVPASVPALYGLLALDQAGMSAAYEAWAADPARTFAERAFINKALTWRRDNEVLAAGAAALGINSAQLDALLIAADALRIADAG